MTKEEVSFLDKLDTLDLPNWNEIRTLAIALPDPSFNFCLAAYDKLNAIFLKHIETFTLPNINNPSYINKFLMFLELLQWVKFHLAAKKITSLNLVITEYYLKNSTFTTSTNSKYLNACESLQQLQNLGQDQELQHFLLITLLQYYEELYKCQPDYEHDAEFTGEIYTFYQECLLDNIPSAFGDILKQMRIAEARNLSPRAAFNDFITEARSDYNSQLETILEYIKKLKDRLFNKPNRFRNEALEFFLVIRIFAHARTRAHSSLTEALLNEILLGTLEQVELVDNLIATHDRHALSNFTTFSLTPKKQIHLSAEHELESWIKILQENPAAKIQLITFVACHTLKYEKFFINPDFKEEFEQYKQAEKAKHTSLININSYLPSYRALIVFAQLVFFALLATLTIIFKNLKRTTLSPAIPSTIPSTVSSTVLPEQDNGLFNPQNIQMAVVVFMALGLWYYKTRATIDLKKNTDILARFEKAFLLHCLQKIGFPLELFPDFSVIDGAIKVKNAFTLKEEIAALLSSPAFYAKFSKTKDSNPVEPSNKPLAKVE